MFLLDTSVLLWALQGDQEKLGPIYDAIANPDHFSMISVVSYWEIVIKKALGKLDIPDELRGEVAKNGFEWLKLEVRHIEWLEVASTPSQ